MPITYAKKGSRRASLASDMSGVPFWVKPYLQLGSSCDSFSLLWFSFAGRGHWQVQYRMNYSGAGPDDWCDLVVSLVQKHKLGRQTVRKLRVSLPAHSLTQSSISQAVSAELSCEIGSRAPEYRILFDNKVVFASTYKMPSTSSSESKVVVFGDFGDGSTGASRVAAAVAKADPDKIVIVGDLTYELGRVTEYLKYFFPVINSDATAGADNDDSSLCQRAAVLPGASLLRSRLTVAVVGNHDVAMPWQIDSIDKQRYSDQFGFFMFWHGSGNGPKLAPKTLRQMFANSKKAKMLVDAHGYSFLGSTNYSYDWGNQHWIVLDANKYVDWSCPELRAWLEADLKAAQGQRWKFVCFHQPGFNSHAHYYNEHRMRLICDILEAGGVDIVLSGHCHIYERHRPLRFALSSCELNPDGSANGEILIDFAFDGITNTRPDGPIYIVTGAGGQLVSYKKTPKHSPLSPSTAVLVDSIQSFTQLSIRDDSLDLSQIAIDGSVIDLIRITKP